MRHGLSIAAVLILQLMGANAMAAQLDDVRWQQRVLLLFGDSKETQKQWNRFAGDVQALRERQLLVMTLDDDVQVLAGRAPEPLPETRDLQRLYNVAPGTPFVAVLIGLDGGEKWRSVEPFVPERLIGIIDAMPMRRAGSK
jgi:hypothetical protein